MNPAKFFCFIILSIPHSHHCSFAFNSLVAFMRSREAFSFYKISTNSHPPHPSFCLCFI